MIANKLGTVYIEYKQTLTDNNKKAHQRELIMNKNNKIMATTVIKDLINK